MSARCGRSREDGQHGAIARVADRLDIKRETLRNWVNGERRKREQPKVVDLKAEVKRLPPSTSTG